MKSDEERITMMRQLLCVHPGDLGPEITRGSLYAICKMICKPCAGLGDTYLGARLVAVPVTQDEDLGTGYVPAYPPRTWGVHHLITISNPYMPEERDLRYAEGWCHAMHQAHTGEGRTLDDHPVSELPRREWRFEVCGSGRYHRTTNPVEWIAALAQDEFFGARMWARECHLECWQ